ncbi:hypothetical protein JS533_006490 [Bifidobacterium amazonense]|uniref:Asp-tRNAAsn/Glu-tRNAGln amidotransferase A subunit n=1 Tax=Bifidobacterium amazonense TaxID=2809027 RepID=A0ABS9VUZ0_9BIFI|nr:hypothetical protein [Bifidobacterium amazonense]MCH9275920.1 hypothetical protein [Bifidobacterium amazonense]
MTANEQESRQEHANDDEGMSPSRRAWIMRGLVTPIFGLLAVTCIVLGLFNATVWKPSSEITATGTVNGVRYIATDPGVLPLVDDASTLTVTTSGGSDVCVALGSSKDVNGWINGESYARVTGLSDWTTLSTEVSSAKQSASADDQSQDVAFRDSDMWTHVVCGSGKATLKTTVSDTSDSIALVDLGESGQATVSLHWVRETLPDFAMPFYFAGGLLALMAVLTASLFAMPPHKRRKRVIESRLVQEEVTVAQAISGSLARVMPSRRPRGSRRRHAGGRSRSDMDETAIVTSGGSHDDVAQPTIIDPSSRNLVADQAARNEQAERAEQSDVQVPDVARADGGSSHDRFAPAAQPASALRFDVDVATDDRTAADEPAADTTVTAAAEPDREPSSGPVAGPVTDTTDEPVAEPRGAHARVAQSTNEEPPVVQPSLPRRRRHRASGSGHAADEANNEVTSVISSEELQAYFARLAQETTGSDADGEKEERQ